MKINPVWIFTFFLLNVVFGSAQLPKESLSNNKFLIENKLDQAFQSKALEQIKSANSSFAAPFILSSANSSLSKNQYGNCDETLAPLSVQAAPCNGVSVTSISFIKANRIKESSAINDNTVNVVYRYTNAGTAPDGTVIDALVTVTNYINNQDVTPTTFRDADLFLNPDTNLNVGFDGNLQPSLEPETNTLPNATSWTGSITYKIQFVRSGTTTPKTITVAAITIDNDGSSICGGLKESVTYSAAANQTLTSNTTNQIQNGNTFTPNSNTVQSGIGIGIDYASAGLFVNVTELSWTYSFATSGTCSAGSASENRFGSLNMTCQINFGKNFTTTTLSGIVYNDTNGLTDNTVNGTGTNAGGLYANLLSGNDTDGYFVVASVAVNTDGTYSFPMVPKGKSDVVYKVQISTNQGVESSYAPVKRLPMGWTNTGENLGTAATNDGTADGLLSVTIGPATTTVTNANFGIEQPPTANNSSLASQVNPGGTTNVTVTSTKFTASDPSTGGTVTKLRITAFPSNATSITIGTTTYTAATFPAGGVTIPTNAAGNPTQTIAVDPIDGTVTVNIQFVAIDNADVESSVAATVSVPFGAASISGNVFNDVNGLTDSTVNGSGTNAGGSLFALLVNSSGNLVQSVAVAAGGAYSFPGVAAGNYTVQLSTTAGTVGSAAPTVTLPAGWSNTGQNASLEPGNDGTNDGKLTVTALASGDVTDANFGIEQRPTAGNNTAASRINPGGTTSSTVAAATFTTADTEPGTVSSIRIIALPSNATSITINGVLYGTGGTAFPAGGVTIPVNTSGNPTQTIAVDPINGAVTVVIQYVAVDNANVETASPATASVPFTLAPTAAGGEISGRLSFNNLPLRNALVVLYDNGSNSTQFTRTDANGDYAFTEKTVGKTYIVQPLSSKYSFNSSAKAINLFDSAVDTNFEALTKTYHPKNDFDGDGKSDLAVFRPNEGNWYVQRSSDNQTSVFNFGLNGDVPVSADFDGDGKTDYAVFRPSEGNWYIWQSKTQDLRVESFGLANDKLVPADYDGDGKTDIAVYRAGNWYIRHSADGAFEARSYGSENDIPAVGDYDNDGQADLSVFRTSDGNWYTLKSSTGVSASTQFGISTDIPVAGDYDGDGYADLGQFRNGNWYVLNSTTGFEAKLFGSARDESIVGDYDGDGRADYAIYRGGIWLVTYSASGKVKSFSLGLPTDVLIK